MRTHRLASLLSILVCLGWSACDAADDDDSGPDDDDSAAGDDDDTADDDTADDDDSGTDDDDSAAALDPCTFPDDAAALVTVVEHYHQENEYAQVSGSVFESPYPTFQEIVVEEGACRTMRMAYGYCDPPCDMGEVCTADDVCVAFPAGISAGDLTVEGLGDPIVIEAQEYSPGYYWGPWDLDADIFEAGDPIDVSFSGDTFPAVQLHVRGVATIDRDLATDVLTLVDGQDNVLTWTPGDDPGACVELRVNGANAAHGMPLDDLIWCLGPDTGSLTIPRAVVEAFPHGATEEICVSHDCPESELRRTTRQSVETGAGRAAAEVRSITYFTYEHP